MQVRPVKEDRAHPAWCRPPIRADQRYPNPISVPGAAATIRRLLNQVLVQPPRLMRRDAIDLIRAYDIGRKKASRWTSADLVEELVGGVFAARHGQPLF